MKISAIKKSIYLKLVFIFFCVILTSIILAFFITFKIHYSDLKDNLRKDLNNSVDNIITLYKEDDLKTLDTLVNMTFYPIKEIAICNKNGVVYEISKNNKKIDISPNEIKTIIDNKISLNEEIDKNITIFKNKQVGSYFNYNGEDYALIIQIYNTSDMIKINKWLLLNLFFVISTGVIGYMLVARNIVRPIKKLTLATKTVSSGDYNFQMKENREDEIGELINTFNYMLVELNKIEKMRQEFVSNVSHEIKTPVTAIKGFSDLLTYEEVSKDERIHYANVIKEEVLKITYLSDNLLKLASLDNNEANLSKEIFRLDEQIRRCILDLEIKWNEKQIEFDLDIPKVNVIADKNLLYHIWSNLISNAIKFSNKNSIIKITLNEDDEYINFEITDNGIGIDEENLNRVFERFYKSDISRNSEGTGLGLSIVHKIVILHNGDIKVESRKDGGTSFYVKLPKK